MMKKLLSLVCCLLPMGAGAVVVEPETGQNSVSTEQATWIAAINEGKTITINAPNVNGIVSQNGFSVDDNMYVGMANDQGNEFGSLYVLNTVKNPFTVVSSGQVSIGSILQVLDGKTLEFKANDSNYVVFDLTVGSGGVNEGIYVGNSENTATLTLSGIDALTVNGSVVTYGDFSAEANSVVVGAINVNSGDFNVESTGAVEFDGLVAGGTGATEISGLTITSNGAVQNNAGDMSLTAQGGINITGNLENAVASDMTVSGGVLDVSGTVKNDNVGGSLILNVAGLHVGGGTQNAYSFVNSGNLYATVAGETYLEYGLNLSGMQSSNEFSLTTKTLKFGANAQTDKWFGAFANNLNKFNIDITDGDLENLTTVLNGAGGNLDATMSVGANNIYANSVQNNGKSLNLNADQNITIAGAVVGSTGETKLVAADTLTVVGGVSNLAKTVLNGNVVNVASLSNAGLGTELTVSSLTETSGTININGGITNVQGTTTVWAKNVDIAGTIINNSGTTIVRGSDSQGGDVSVGSVNVAGGVMDLDALAGDMSIDSALTVSEAGVLQLGSSLRNLTVGGTARIAGSLNAAENGAMGDVNIAASGSPAFVMDADAILIGGDINVVDSAVVRNIKLHAPVIDVSGNATVENSGYLTLGTDATSYVHVVGDLSANNGGVFESYANDLVVGTLSGDSKFIMHGANITANNGDIDITGNVYFDADNDPVAPANGLVVKTTDILTLKTTQGGTDINVGALSVGVGNTLVFDSADSVDIGGVIANNGTVNIDAVGNADVSGKTTNTGTLKVVADVVSVAGINNKNYAEFASGAGAIKVGDITNSGTLSIVSATDVMAGAILQTAGVMDLSADLLEAQSLSVSGNAGTQANIDASVVEIAGVASVMGDFVQGGTDGMLNLRATDFSASNLTIGGNFIAASGNTTYDIDANISIAGNISVADGVFATLDAGRALSAADLTNSGQLKLKANQGIVLDEIINNAGVINIDSGAGMLEANALTMNAGAVMLNGAGLNMTGAIATGAMLYQNWGSTLSDKDINVVADDYVITTAGLDVAGINQDGRLTVNTSDVDVGGDIIADNLRFVASPNGNWVNVAVDGSVSGNVDFIGLEKMTIGGNYTFNDGSQINAAILPYAVSGGGMNETDINYWASVSLNDDETLGQITNAADAGALITVGGKFESDLNMLGSLSADGVLGQPQIGIDIFDVVDQGTAIWFLHAEDGVSDLATKIRNLNVSFCNADGTICMDYLSALSRKDTDDDGEQDKDINGSDEDLPAYVSVRDVNEDGVADSLYIVFDPRFGGPVEVFKIQPIVARADDRTRGEYVSAGALDNMIAGQLINKKFFNRTPIEVIPLIFDGTNLSTMANELYNRMEDYVLNREGGALARFSRLFQVREIEQIVGAVALNEHTSFRSFEDRMLDEFIWNRNRNLNKAWLDVDYGMFYQNIDDGKHTDGHRFSVAGGFDWQESNTLQLGLTGRVSHTTSQASDAIDLSYAGTIQAGDVAIDVADTNIGLGAYLMKILGEKTRLYGNAFLDLHVLDVDRTQTFVERIEGDGTAFSLISEWGLMHDILNQYVVGNAYVRAGYNFGFSVKEKVAGDDYMRLQSDGYFVLTPGYSLIAQKRIYPSAWFQIRPYASIGVEYDVFGAPDYAEYKFVVADEFTRYDVDIDPLWANIGGGVELLSARGLQFGIDYRYQYNDAIQLHNIRVSGSYRF